MLQSQDLPQTTILDYLFDVQSQLTPEDIFFVRSCTFSLDNLDPDNPTIGWANDPYSERIALVDFRRKVQLSKSFPDMTGTQAALVSMTCDLVAKDDVITPCNRKLYRYTYRGDYFTCGAVVAQRPERSAIQSSMAFNKLEDLRSMLSPVMDTACKDRLVLSHKLHYVKYNQYYCTRLLKRWLLPSSLNPGQFSPTLPPTPYTYHTCPIPVYDINGTLLSLQRLNELIAFQRPQVDVFFNLEYRNESLLGILKFILLRHVTS
ncbi:hypothetical protein CVT24_006385 [Panaeolus cyanescens]|uniref:Uncharacterized protein n=1 Tax=Panaeolus cyanescens TaxID=181874 RepID=A0A409WVG1_9AGAR|nr:hypothetical protein CVT24_006385 [Panaeolus cyanescens]